MPEFHPSPHYNQILSPLCSAGDNLQDQEKSNLSGAGNKIIVELSSKVSEQSSLIASLQRTLEEKDKIIENLQCRVFQKTPPEMRHSDMNDAKSSPAHCISNITAEAAVHSKQEGPHADSIASSSGQCDPRDIAPEMNMMIRRRKKKKGSKSSNEGTSEWSGRSQDSGVQLNVDGNGECSGRSRQSSAASNRSALSGWSSEEEEDSGRVSKGTNRPDGHPLDPASIRRISAPKGRRGKKSDSGSQMLGLHKCGDVIPSTDILHSYNEQNKNLPEVY